MKSNNGSESSDLEKKPNSKITKAAANSLGAVAGTVTSQPFSLPIYNLMSVKYVKPNISYADIAKNITQTEGLSGFYKTWKNNTIRRSITTTIPMALASFVKDEYDLSPLQTSSLAAIFETAISLSRGELKEKYQTSRSEDIEGFNRNKVKAASFIGARNFLFAGSIFGSGELVDKFMKSYGNDIASQNDIDKEQVKSFANLITKTTLVAGTTPLDRSATMLSAGKSLKDIAEQFKENPKKLFTGGLARTAYGTLAAIAISKGIEASNTFLDNYLQSKTDDRSR